MAIYVLIESVKTTSMENVSTGVLDKNKEHYLRCKDITLDIIKAIVGDYMKNFYPIHMSQIKFRENISYFPFYLWYLWKSSVVSSVCEIDWCSFKGRMWFSGFACLSGCVNTLRPRLNGRHFADDIFTCILLNENVSIGIKISLKFVPKGPINNIPALVQLMAWRRSGDKPLSEPMMVSLLTHICVTRHQWVKYHLIPGKFNSRWRLCHWV